MIFDKIGVDGQPSCKTIWGTHYVTWVYIWPKPQAYILLGFHLIITYISARFIKPEGIDISKIGYPIQLVWRQRPHYIEKKLRCRYCFEYKYEENGHKPLPIID